MEPTFAIYRKTDSGDVEQIAVPEVDDGDLPVVTLVLPADWPLAA